VVVIKHPELKNIFATRYDHLRTNSIRVRPGDRVKKGQPIGIVGSAGQSTTRHLHFEVWGKTFYDPVSPWGGKCGKRSLEESLWEDQMRF
jgi:murein DD-endopeptidase MepM/ murein hydrolase activator NlpD